MTTQMTEEEALAMIVANPNNLIKGGKVIPNVQDKIPGDIALAISSTTHMNTSLTCEWELVKGPRCGERCGAKKVSGSLSYCKAHEEMHATRLLKQAEKARAIRDVADEKVLATAAIVFEPTDPDYAPGDDYTIGKYMDEFTDKKFVNFMDARVQSVKALRRVVRYVKAGKKWWICRNSNHCVADMYRVYPKLELIKEHKERNFSYDIVSEDGRTLRSITKNIFHFSNHESLGVDSVDSIPYINVRPNIPGVFNKFPGFKAKLTQQVDMDLIQPILNHLNVVWCKSNPENYKWLLSYLAYPFHRIKHGLKSKTGVALVMLGTEGCGKSIIGDFLINCVYGTDTAVSMPTLDHIMGKFNATLDSKLLVVAQEVSAGDSTSTWIKAFETLKSYTTDGTIPIERKGLDVDNQVNNMNLLLFTNNTTSMRVAINDRRICIMECNDKLLGNTDYFSALGELLTQEMADHFFTYLVNYLELVPVEERVVDISKFPKTEARQNAIDMGKNSVEVYITGIRSGDIDLGCTVYTVGSQKVIISSQLYQAYCTWCKTTNNQLKNETVFYKEKILKDFTLIRCSLPGEGQKRCRHFPILIQE